MGWNEIPIGSNVRFSYKRNWKFLRSPPQDDLINIVIVCFLRFRVAAHVWYDEIGTTRDLKNIKAMHLMNRVFADKSVNKAIQ